MAHFRPNVAWLLAWIFVGDAVLSLTFQTAFGATDLAATSGFIVAALLVAVWSWLQDRRELLPDERAGLLSGYTPVRMAGLGLLLLGSVVGLAVVFDMPWHEAAFGPVVALTIAFAIHSRERPHEPSRSTVR